MTKILITGARSFVGTNFQRFSKYKEVDEISLYEHNPEEIDFAQYEIVLHLAAIVHQSKKIPDEQYFLTNRDLCINVAKHAKKGGVKQFIFLSTIKVYGDFITGTNIRNEDSTCFPDDPYGKSKLEAEFGLRKLEGNDFIVSIIRTPLVYGEGVKANMMRLVRLIEKVPILPFMGINNKRNFTYIENLVGYIDQIIEKKASGVFIAMDVKAISTTELLNILSKYLGKKNRLFKLPELFVRVGKYFIPRVFERLYGSLEFDNTRTLKELDYEPPFSTEEGIKKMIFAYKNGNSK